MKRYMGWQVLALVAGLIVSAEARAQEASAGAVGNFGSPGQIVISSDFKASLGFTSISGPGDHFDIDLQPSLDYFLKENLSIGGTLYLSTSLRDGDDPLLIGVGIRGGYNIPLTGSVSVWPKLGLAVAHSDGFLVERTYLEVNLSAPFLVHLAPHFFFGAGPGLITQLGDDTVATLHVSAVVGGYF